MNLKNKIIEYFYPFTNKPEDFVLKNKATWYSNRFRYILYSGNGGKTFKKLLCAHPPLCTLSEYLLEYNWTFEEETFDCETEVFSYYKDKFKSLKDIDDYCTAEYQEYLDGKKDILLKRKLYLQQLNKNIQ